MFADGCPLLLSSENSVEYINSKSENDVTSDRFRPNIIIGGCNAFDEVLLFYFFPIICFQISESIQGGQVTWKSRKTWKSRGNWSGNFIISLFQKSGKVTFFTNFTRDLNKFLVTTSF